MDQPALSADRHLFDAEQAKAALGVARTEDIRRMDDAALTERPQVASRGISKWRNALTPLQVAGFEAIYGDLIRSQGYRTSNVVQSEMELSFQ